MEKKEKKGGRARIVVIVIAVILVLGIIGSAMGGSSSDDEDEGSVDMSVAEVEETEDDEYRWDPGELAYLGLDREQILEIYDYYMELIDDPSADDLTGDEITQYEDECREKVAEKYDITTEDVDNIFYASLNENYFATFDVDNVKIKYGELKDIVVTGDDVQVSVKITSSTSNESAIEQCYFDACDFIRNYAGTDYKEVIFAGFADFQNGSEMKFIQFTVPDYMIEIIATEDFADNTLGDYVDDLWIIESMRED